MEYKEGNYKCPTMASGKLHYSCKITRLSSHKLQEGDIHCRQQRETQLAMKYKMIS